MQLLMRTILAPSFSSNNVQAKQLAMGPSIAVLSKNDDCTRPRYKDEEGAECLLCAAGDPGVEGRDRSLITALTVRGFRISDALASALCSTFILYFSLRTRVFL